jgi:hypothetical protein
LNAGHELAPVRVAREELIFYTRRPHATYKNPYRTSGRATLAQPVEQLIRNQQVVGSNPTGGSNEIKDFSC